MAEIASAYISILPEMRGMSSNLQKGLVGPATSAGKTAGSRFGKVFGSSALTPMKGLVTGFVGLMAAQKVAGFLKDSIAEAREAQVVGQRTESVIKSMGLTGKVSAGQIGSLAMAISNKTAIDDEAIQSGQNLLLTFKNIASSAGESNGVFSQTSQLMVDMSAAMGTDVKSSAIQLGKALNDPVKGVSALTRVGVSFTEGQKKQISSLVESGKLFKAQGIVLGEVKKQFGGAAASMSTPAERAKVAWANFQEQIGGLLLPVIDRFLTALSGKVIPAISTFVSQIQSGTGVGGRFAAAFSALGSVLGAVFGFINRNRGVTAAFVGTIVAITVATAAWNAVLALNPITLVVVALAALVAGLVYAYQHFETFRTVVDAVFGFLKTVVTATIGFVTDHWKLILVVIGGPLAAVGLLVAKHWTAIKSFVTTAVSAVINFVRDHWRLIITIIGGPLGLAVALVTKYWGQIKSATQAVWNVVKSVISTQINAAKTVVSLAIDAIRGYFNLIGAIVGKVREWFGNIVSAVRDKLGAAVDLAKSFPGRVVDALGDIGSALYDKGKALIQGLINGIKSMAGSIGSAIKSVLPDIPGIDIPGLASGGRVTAGQTYLVGEQGPELFTSSRAGYIVPNHTLNGVVSRGRESDLGPKLDRMSRQLEALTRVSAAQGREFGREINNAAAHGARKGGR